MVAGITVSSTETSATRHPLTMTYTSSSVTRMRVRVDTSSISGTSVGVSGRHPVWLGHRWEVDASVEVVVHVGTGGR